MKGEDLPDRRVQRTRQLLLSAMIETVLEKGYEATTVQDIIDRANVGRSTFYSHFQDKEHLLMSGSESMLRAFEDFRAGAGPGSNWELSLALFKHVEARRKVFKALLDKQVGNLVLERIQDSLTIYFADHLGANLKGRRLPVPLELLTRSLISSLLGILTLWLEEDLPYPAEKMNDYFRELTEPTIRALLGSA
jgi:AcrR family transcriptional regulator